MSGLLTTVVAGSTALSLLGTIGGPLLVQAITATTGSIIGSVKYVTSSNKPGLKEISKALKDIDLEFFIGVLEELVKEQENKANTESIKKALCGVQEILQNIEKELQIIKDDIEIHNSKYISGWRSFNCTCNIESIHLNKKILDQRYNTLVDLLKIYNK